MKKLTDSLSNSGQIPPKRDEEFNLADMAESKGPPTDLDDKACSQLKQSQLFSNKKPDQTENQRFNRWLDNNDNDQNAEQEDRLRSYDPEMSDSKSKNYNVKNKLKSLSTNSLNQKFQSLQESQQKEEDTNFYANNLRMLSVGSDYKTEPKKEVKPAEEREDNLENDNEECSQYYQSMQGLMAEKERLNQEQQKIRENKFLKMVDRSNAIKSVRSLSRTIDDLLSKEKEKISEHYQSKISQLSKSKMSSVAGENQSKILGHISSEKNECDE